DRFGRRPTMLLSLALFGVLTLLKGTASTMTELMLLQLMAGIGIGGAYPNALALASEYAPARRRSVVVTFCAMGYLVGTSLGGVISATLLPLYGWRSVFLVGGALALAVMAAGFVIVPESIKKLLLDSGSHRSVRDILNRMAPDLDLSSPVRFISAE